MGIDLLDITCQIEESLEFRLTPADLTSILHDDDILVGDFYDLLLQKLSLCDAARHDSQLADPLPAEFQDTPRDPRCVALWQRLTEILAKTLMVDADRITFRSRLIRDLGMS